MLDHIMCHLHDRSPRVISHTGWLEMTLTFQLLCNFGNSMKLFNCPEILKLCIKSVFFQY
jgi:hypothetical protein